MLKFHDLPIQAFNTGARPGWRAVPLTQFVFMLCQYHAGGNFAAGHWAANIQRHARKGGV